MQACRSFLETDDADQISVKPSPENWHSCYSIFRALGEGFGKLPEKNIQILTQCERIEIGIRIRSVMESTDVLPRSLQTSELQNSFIDLSVHWDLRWPVSHLNISCSNKHGGRIREQLLSRCRRLCVFLTILCLYVLFSFVSKHISAAPTPLSSSALHPVSWHTHTDIRSEWKWNESSMKTFSHELGVFFVADDE